MNWKSSDKYLKRLIKESGGGGSADLYVHNIYIDGSALGTDIPYVNLCFITKDSYNYDNDQLLQLFETLGPSKLVCNGYIVHFNPTPIFGPIIGCSWFYSGSSKGLELRYVVNFNDNNSKTTIIYNNFFPQLRISDSVLPMVSL